MIELKHRNGTVLYTAQNATGVRQAVREAIAAGAYLAGADLTGADLAGANLTGAYLTGAYLAGAYLTRANLTRANLTRANLARADLARADLTSANLTRANLTDANLARANLTRANLARANLTDANLTGADLTSANLTRVDLTRANLTSANLTGANLAGANLAELPELENIDGKILAAVEAAQAAGKAGLDMRTWHMCETTHCIAGWAIALSGQAGADLEERIGPAAAGALIYARNGVTRIPDFYTDTDTALQQLRERAAAGVGEDNQP